MLDSRNNIPRGGLGGSSRGTIADDTDGGRLSLSWNTVTQDDAECKSVGGYERIPQELRERRQWVAARIVPSTKRPGKTDKYPIDPKTGRMAETDNPATWGTFEEAIARKEHDRLDAFGFVFSQDDPYTGIDLDNVIDANGEIEQWARYYVYLLDSYTEVSCSETGLHIIVRGSLPPTGRKRGQVEMYDAGRFFVFTGQVLDDRTEIRDAQAAVNRIHAETFGVPDPPAEPARQQPAHVVNLADADLLAKAQAAHNGAKFTALWGGNTSGYSSPSEADLALCSLLGFWAGGDANRVDGMFRQSGLFREKWDKSHYADGATYGQRTVVNALRGLTQFYDGNGRQPPDVSYVAQHDACEPPAWMDDEGQELPSTPPQGGGKAAQVAPQRSTSTPQYQTSWTPAELLSTVFPEPVWAVPDLITVGLTLLAGRPKVGKSWLANQTAIAVGTGGMVLDRRVKQGKVLYLALEDNARRLQKRARLQGMPSTAGIRYELAWPLFTHDGIEKLDAAITEHGYTLVVIDTIGRALGRADTQDWTDMNTYVGELQQLAHTHDVAILCLDHHRKPNGLVSDPVDDIVGTTAKSAVADCLVGLYREQGKAGAKLSVRGRDIEDQQWGLAWDNVTCTWQYAGTVEEVAMQGNKTKVVDALRNSDAPMTLTDLATATGLGKNNLQPILVEMANDGILERLQKQGREVPYRLAGV